MTEENIYKILIEIEQSLLKLKEIRRVSQDKFSKDTDLQDRAKWNFYVLVQGCLDLGNHIIAAKRLGLPETYEEIIRLLRGAGLIEPDIEEVLLKMAGFRNRLAHGYFKLNPLFLYSYLNNLEIVERFILSVKDTF